MCIHGCVYIYMGIVNSAAASMVFEYLLSIILDIYPEV